MSDTTDDIFKKTDKTGVVIGTWAKPGKVKKQLWCSWCEKPVPYDHGGVNQVNQHVKGKKHDDQRKLRNPEKQSSLLPSQGKLVLAKSKSRAVSEAEILWCFKVAEEDWSFSSCDRLALLFQRMFQGSPAADGFAMAHSKASYVIRHAIGPVVLKELVNDVNSSNNKFTLMLDETTTKQVKKQMDFLVRYWSESEGQVVTRYIDSKFFGHAKANDLCDLVMQVFQKNSLEVELLMNLSTDGPNINKSLWTKLNEKLISLGYSGLLPFVACVLHILHTAFHYGVKVYGTDTESHCLDLHGWFKIAPCKREDIRDLASKIGESSPIFKRHVESRWLTLVPAVEMVEKHWVATKMYFLEFLPKQEEFKTHTSNNERYNRICTRIRNEKKMLVEMAFLMNSSSPYQKLLLWFQTDAPLIHLLFHELKQLLVAVMKRFIKSEEVDGKSAKSLLKLDVSDKNILLPLEEIEIGAKTSRLLKELSPFDQKAEKEKMLKSYIASTKQLQRRLPLENTFIFNAGCLNPGSRTQKNSLVMIERLAKLLPHVVAETEVSAVKDEWRLYMVESERKLPQPTTPPTRIDHYWKAVLEIKSNSGELKYTKLPALVKAVLSFQNANASVERSLSDNKNTVTSERLNLLPETIVALRLMKEHARKYGGAHLVPITDEMVDAVATAKLNDTKRQKVEAEKKSKSEKEKEILEEEKRCADEKLKIISQSKLTLQQRDEEIDKKEAEAQQSLVIAQELLKHGTDQLMDAKGDASALGVATAMISTAQEKMKEADDQLRKLSEESKRVRKRKAQLLDSCENQLKKNKI